VARVTDGRPAWDAPPTEVRLADGSVVVMRPIRAEDRELLREGFERLSPQSRYFRFFSPVDHLSESLLTYFCDVDQHDHVALGAVRRIDGREVGVGIARCIRLADEPHAAEAAVAVADDHHGRGIGTMLLEALAAVALQVGVDEFRLLVRRDNHAMLDVLERLGATTRPTDEAAVACCVLALPRLAAELRDSTLWAVFVSFARGEAELDRPGPRPAGPGPDREP